MTINVTPIRLKSFIKRRKLVDTDSFLAFNFDTEKTTAFCRTIGDWNHGIYINDTERFGGPVSPIIDSNMVTDSDYVLVYKLPQAKKLEDKLSGQAVEPEKRFALKVLIVATGGNKSSSVPGELVDPTPEELLGLIQSAQIVVTNSFYEVVFSILFKRKFLALLRDIYPDKKNLRLTELLAEYKLEHRYFDHSIPNNLMLNNLFCVENWEMVS